MELGNDSTPIDVFPSVQVVPIVMYPFGRDVEDWEWCIEEGEFTRKSFDIKGIPPIGDWCVEGMSLHCSSIVREKSCTETEISYLIQVPELKGKFCPEKAKQLGIPKVRSIMDDHG